MGIQDRDYWRERYRARGNVDPEHWRQDELTSLDVDFRPPKNNELNFVGKLFLTIFVALICVIAYRGVKDRLSRPEPVREVVGQRQGAPSAAPASPAGRSAEPPVVRAPSSEGQVYRCGNAYSSQPCEGGKPVIISSPVASAGDASGMREIYLCKDFQGRLFWESTACSLNGRFMERIASVPANVSWEQQVVVAQQQWAKARSVASEQIVSVAPRQAVAKANASECQALEDRVNWLDSLGRAGGGVYTMDWIREQRRLARDRQFRIGC
ncbi:hypothetical protein [Comamonas terrae]|uniref:DUF1311 domain-containing protein n=1 Tax=Comamonas terrae TaxID=673548 RepID=A0ABW5UNF6_9BURK|nr:hypothetical protein [Comamonas terrae]